MAFDTDKYYTPPDLAIQVLERADLSNAPLRCVDTTCGAGHLLQAAKSVYSADCCIGLDNDRSAIAALRRRQPTWILSVANLLNPASCRGAQVVRYLNSIDMLVLNPPFSHAPCKYVHVSYGGDWIKSSMAMAYILRSFQLFTPNQGAVAIVPESLLYSEVDAEARGALSRRFRLKKLLDLDSQTFKGARVHSSAVQFVPGASRRVKARASGVRSPSVGARLVRGALPVHASLRSKSGVPFVHTTDLGSVCEAGRVETLSRTESRAKGRVKGWAILLPRVGIPQKTRIKPVLLTVVVQLSDCVIAITSERSTDMARIAASIESHFDSFRRLYRGTGARYITVTRLSCWLSKHRISVTI